MKETHTKVSKLLIRRLQPGKPTKRSIPIVHKLEFVSLFATMMRLDVQTKVATNETNCDLDTSMRSESERSHSSVSLASLSTFAKNLKKQAGGLKQKMSPFKNWSKFSNFEKMDADFQNLSILFEASHEFSQEFQAEMKDLNESIAKLNYSETTMQTCNESVSNISVEEGDELCTSLGSSERVGEWVVDTEGPGHGVNLVVPREGQALPHMQLCITRSPGRRVRFNLDTEQDEFLATKLSVSPKSPPPKSILIGSPNYSPKSSNTFTPHSSPTTFSSPPLFEPNELDASSRSTDSTDSMDLSREKRKRNQHKTNGRLLSAAYCTAPRTTLRRGGRRRRHRTQHVQAPSSPSQRLTLPNW